MNAKLVHMLEAIRQRCKKLDQEARDREIAQQTAEYEQWLMELTIQVAGLIEENFHAAAPDGRFSADGLTIPIGSDCPFLPYLRGSVTTSSHSWYKFVQGWSKAGISVGFDAKAADPVLEFKVQNR